MNAKRQNREAGYAVLMVYSMAVIIAIMLFMQIPRAAFEAQRNREQLLIDHGEQYSRAIQLFVRKFNRYPPDFDALNSTQNIRFLRRKYKDPMTGKDVWRVIHVGPGGVFTDSLLHEKKDDSKLGQPQNFITELAPLGGSNDPSQNVNIATRQRQSDVPGAPGDPNNPVQPQPFDPNGNPIQPANGQQPGGFTFPIQPQQNANGTPMAPGQPFPGQNLPGSQFQNQGLPNQDPNSGFPNQNPGFPNQGVNQGFPNQNPGFGNPSFPNQNPNSGFPNQNPGFPPQGFPNQPFAGNPVLAQPPQQPAAGAPGGAAGLINQLLTTPRPGGLNGLGGVQQGMPNPAAPQGTSTSTLSGPPGTPIQQAAGQTTIGGGIAGVASKREEEGIKVYNDQTSYHKWEFVYDITKDPARAVPAAGQMNANGQNPNAQNPNGQNPGAAAAFSGAPGSTPTTTTMPPPPPPGPTPQPQ